MTKVNTSRTEVYQKINISYFSTKTYVVGTQKNLLNETVLSSTKNICANSAKIYGYENINNFMRILFVYLNLCIASIHEISQRKYVVGTHWKCHIESVFNECYKKWTSKQDFSTYRIRKQQRPSRALAACTHKVRM